MWSFAGYCWGIHIHWVYWLSQLPSQKDPFRPSVKTVESLLSIPSTPAIQSAFPTLNPDHFLASTISRSKVGHSKPQGMDKRSSEMIWWNPRVCCPHLKKLGVPSPSCPGSQRLLYHCHEVRRPHLFFSKWLPVTSGISKGKSSWWHGNCSFRNVEELPAMTFPPLMLYESWLSIHSAPVSCFLPWPFTEDLKKTSQKNQGGKIHPTHFRDH